MRAALAAALLGLALAGHGICEEPLPSTWTAETLAWTAPYGARAAPVVVGDRACLLGPDGKGVDVRERLVCLDPDTGQSAFEHRLDVALTTAVAGELGRSSPAIDSDTGLAYALGLGGTLVALARDGRPAWERSLTEQLGLLPETASGPALAGELVLVAGAFADGSRTARVAAFDRRSGETVWLGDPGGRPCGVASLSAAASVGADGVLRAVQPASGRLLWQRDLGSCDASLVAQGAWLLVSTGIGMTAVDAASGLQRWSAPDVIPAAPPASDGERVYVVTGAGLQALDAATGRPLWTKDLGLGGPRDGAGASRAAPVLGDGKLYLGTQDGRFLILRPGAEGAELLDEHRLEAGEAILAPAVVFPGRVLVASTKALYCLGRKPLGQVAILPPKEASVARGGAPPSLMQAVPAEATLGPGERRRFRARVLDADGEILREDAAPCALERLRGRLDPAGLLSLDGAPQAGLVRCSAAGLEARSRVRGFAPLPWKEDFEGIAEGVAPGHWVGAGLAVRLEAGHRVLRSGPEGGRVFAGPSWLDDYAVTVDLRGVTQAAGVIGQGYLLALDAAHGRLELRSWPAADTIGAPFAGQPDVWYRLKLRVEGLEGAAVRIRGKVWPAADPEPDGWSLDRFDRAGHRHGSPGLVATGEAVFDNLKVTPLR